MFVLMVIFVVTAVSNGANMTDGLDGLAAGTSAIIGVALGILAYMSSHFEFASFLNIMFIPGAEELVVYAAAFIGATVGFLWYNSYPAQVFMGDTGSLTLGGIIACFAIIIRKEFVDSDPLRLFSWWRIYRSCCKWPTLNIRRRSMGKVAVSSRWLLYTIISRNRETRVYRH